MKSKTPVILAIILAGVLWGTSPLFADLLSDAGFSAIQMTATRSGVTALTLALVLFVLDRRAFRMRPRLILLAFFAGAGYFLTATLYYFAIGEIGAATAAVLLYTSPIYVLCVSLAFLGEKLTRAKLLATALMLLGCIFVSGVIGGFSGGILGVGVGLLSGAFYGLYNLMTKIAVQGGARPISLTFYTFLFAALLSITFADPIGYARLALGDPLSLVPILFLLGLVTCVLPYFLYTLSLVCLDAGVASALSIVEPMAATLFGILFLAERLSLPKMIGIALILLATLLFCREKSE